MTEEQRQAIGSGGGNVNAKQSGASTPRALGVIGIAKDGGGGPPQIRPREDGTMLASKTMGRRGPNGVGVAGTKVGDAQVRKRWGGGE